MDLVHGFSSLLHKCNNHWNNNLNLKQDKLLKLNGGIRILPKFDNDP